MNHHRSQKLRLHWLAATAFAAMLATPAALAQSSNAGNFEIEAPRATGERGQYGAPVEYVTLSKVVSYRDLDLRTDRDASELNNRVSRAAYSVCTELDRRYPVTAKDSPPCYSTTMNEGLRTAEDVILAARR